MISLVGKYADAMVYTDIVENNAISHIMSMLNQPYMKGTKVRIMPDCHDGKGCVIGTTIDFSNQEKKGVCPNIVGVDIGCGVLAIKLKENSIDLPKLDSVVRKYVDIDRKDEHSRVSLLGLENLWCQKGNVKAVRLGFGTVGGGNHFIEVGHSVQTNQLYLLIHSGSRNLGVQVAKFYQDLAYEEAIVRNNGGTYYDKVQAVKATGLSGKDLDKAIKSIQYPKIGDVPYELAYVTGANFKHYLHDMRICQEYASENRRTIADIIIKKLKLHEIESFDTIHNYIDTDGKCIIRKGAVRAEAGDQLIIPLNMRDGALICKGLGNPDWNYSAPHGAGRLYSRADCKESLSVKTYKEQMAGIFSTCIGRDTIDESPMAYKDAQSIISAVSPTVDIVDRLKPIYNYKGGSSEEKRS
jgi:tRNA-splicing ligase RtcB